MTEDRQGIVTGLTPCTTYTFQIGALNDKGLGSIDGINASTGGSK